MEMLDEIKRDRHICGVMIIWYSSKDKQMMLTEILQQYKIQYTKTSK